MPRTSNESLLKSSYTPKRLLLDGGGVLRLNIESYEPGLRIDPLMPGRPNGGSGGRGSLLPNGGGTKSRPEPRIDGIPDAYRRSNISSS